MKARKTLLERANLYSYPPVPVPAPAPAPATSATCQMPAMPMCECVLGALQFYT